MVKQVKAVKAVQAPSAKQGQATKQAAPVSAFVAPKLATGWHAANTHLTPAQQVKQGVNLTAAPSNSYPQGTANTAIAPLYVGCTSKQQAHHALLLAALGGVGVAHAMPLNVLLAALVANGGLPASGGARRVLRQACRAGLVLWQA